MWHLTLLGVAWIPARDALCPQGFGGGAQAFPQEWRIPPWPKDLPLEQASELHTVTLGGFKKADLNEEYLEGPGEPFRMQGRETYWQASGQYFMYFCQRFDKWRIAAISGFGNNMDGNCFAFVSDAYPGRDILNTSFIKGWIEVDDGNWVYRPEAGVVDAGKLADQMEMEAPAETGNAECDTGAGADSSTGDKDGIGKESTSKCPVMPVIRKAKATVVEATKAAGKWLRRLFPKLLSAPDAEDTVPPDAAAEGNPLFPSGAEREGTAACDPATQNGCSFRQKFYIEKQRNTTLERRRQELARLQNMQDVVMKDEQKDWLISRVDILRKMVMSDEL